MINLIKNEFNKIKYRKIILSIIVYIITLLLMNKYSNKNIADLSFNIIPIIGIFVCLFFGGSISLEIERGTFKYYLTKPIKRYKIYLSKNIVSYIYIYLSIFIVLIISSLIMFKIDLNYYSKFLTYSIPLYLLATFIIYLSNIFKNTSFIICFGVLLFSFSLVLSQLLFNINIKFIEYTFLPYFDFSIFDDNNSLKLLNEEYNIILSLKRGFLIDFIYLFIFYFKGSISFCKRDIRL